MPNEPNAGEAEAGDERLPSPENTTPHNDQNASNGVAGRGGGEGGGGGGGGGRESTERLDFSSDNGVSSQKTDHRSREERGETSQPTAQNSKPHIENNDGKDGDHGDKQAAAAAPPTYLCSQLVGAALAEMGVLGEKGGPGQELDRWLWVLPGSFGQGGAVERGLGCGVSLGEEVRWVR